MPEYKISWSSLDNLSQACGFDTTLAISFNAFNLISLAATSPSLSVKSKSTSIRSIFFGRIEEKLEFPGEAGRGGREGNSIFE